MRTLWHPRLTGFMLGLVLVVLLAVWPTTASAQTSWGAQDGFAWGSPNTGSNATANSNSTATAPSQPSGWGTPIAQPAPAAAPTAPAPPAQASASFAVKAKPAQSQPGWGESPAWGGPATNGQSPAPPAPAPAKPLYLPANYEASYEPFPPLSDYPRSTILDPNWQTDIMAGVGILCLTENGTQGSLFSYTDSGLLTYGGAVRTYGEAKVINDHALTSIDMGLDVSYIYAQHVGFVTTLFFITTSDFHMVQIAPVVRTWLYDTMAFTLSVDYRFIDALIYDFGGTSEMHQVAHRVILAPGICFRPVKTETSLAEFSVRWTPDLGGIIDVFAASIRVSIDYLVIAVDIAGIPRPRFHRDDLTSQSTKMTLIIATLGIRIHW